MSPSTLYVHLADDGGILVIDGETGLSSWITESQLLMRTDAVASGGGRVLLSRGEGSTIAAATARRLDDQGVATTPAEEVHPDAERPDGLTALHSAAYLGALPLLDDLLDRGADVAAQDDDGYTALMYATNAGELDGIVRLLDAGAPVDQSDDEGSTALMFAAHRGDLPAVKKLLANGAHAGQRRRDGLSAEEIARRGGHERVAQVLLSAAATAESGPT